MRSLLLLLALFIALLRPAAASSLEVGGPGITADQLATQLSIFHRSLVFKQDRPFKKLHFALIYKQRKPDGTYEKGKSLVDGTLGSGEPRTEVPLAVFVSEKRSTIQADGSSFGGNGCDLGERYSATAPLPRREGGGYVLLRTLLGHGAHDEENTAGILELAVEAVE